MGKDEKTIISGLKIAEILESIEEEQRVETVRIAGLLDDNTAYNTIFINHRGKKIPFVVTSKGDILEVKRKKKVYQCRNCEKKIEGYIKPIKCVSCDRKDFVTLDRDNYQYFEYNDLKYRFGNDPVFIEGLPIKTVSKEVLKTISEGNADKSFFNDMISITQEFFEHTDPELYDITPVIATLSNLLWFLGKTFYAIPTGREDTGKSTWQRLLSYMQFNGYFGGKGTVAVSSRLIHCGNISLNQDEFDKMDKKSRIGFVGQANTGFYIDGTYPFTDMNQKDLAKQIRVLYTFAQRTFSANDLRYFEKSFLSRCFDFICVRQAKPLKDTVILSEKDKQRFQSIRNRAFAYCILNWKVIEKDIIEAKKELENLGTFGRKTDMYSMILGIVTHFGGDKKAKEIKEYLEDRDKVVDEERKGAWESIIFEYITEKFIVEKEKEFEQVSIPSKEIYTYLLNKLGIDPKDKESLREKGTPKPKNVNTILKAYKLLDKPTTLGYTESGARKYNFRLREFLTVCKRFGFREMAQELEKCIPLENASDASDASVQKEIPQFETDESDASEAKSEKEGGKNL